jgi:hypothetical protein
LPPLHPAAGGAAGRSQAVKAGRIGVLLVNLGSPDAPDVPAVKRFLREFLSDPRVIEIPQILWRPILNLLILNIRPRTTAANYAKVWMEEGSPITVYTRRQAEALQQRMGGRAGRLGHALWHAQHRGTAGGADEGRAAIASCWRRSIRNIRRPPMPPWLMMPRAC